MNVKAGPQVINIADVRKTIIGPVFLHFSGEQWKLASGGATKVGKPPGSSGLLAVVGALPSGNGDMLAVPSCPPGCTPCYTYAEGPITDPKADFIQILIGFDCSGRPGSDPRITSCNIAFRVATSPRGQLATDVPSITMVCVDSSGFVCPDSEPVWFPMSSNSFIYACLPKRR
jgi:hypothetical protein